MTGRMAERHGLEGPHRAYQCRYEAVLDTCLSGQLFSTQSVEFLDYSNLRRARPAGRCSLASLDPTKPEDLSALVSELERLLLGIQHGSVTLIVQDGRVVQLDATHKVRLAGTADPRRNGPRS